MSKKSEPDAEFIAEAQEAYIDEDWLKALDLYDVMVEGYPRYVPGWVHRSACNLKLGRHNDALGDAAKAVKLDDTNPKAHLRKGMAFFELGEAVDGGTALHEQRALLLQVATDEFVESGDALPADLLFPPESGRDVLDKGPVGLELHFDFFGRLDHELFHQLHLAAVIGLPVVVLASEIGAGSAFGLEELVGPGHAGHQAEKTQGDRHLLHVSQISCSGIVDSTSQGSEAGEGAVIIRKSPCKCDRLW